jgi:rhamnosyltransferase
MTFVDYPDREYMLPDKTIDVKNLPALNSGQNQGLKVAIHLHAFYVELLEEFIQDFDKYVENYDLFITTDTEEKRTEILSVLSGSTKLKEIILTGNIGRDVLPWQKIHEKLNQYDIAGHFHTKKSEANAWIVGETWRHDMMDSLIRPAQNIFQLFTENPKIGVVIPDVPTFFDFFHGPAFYNENKLWPKMLDIWDEIDFTGKEKRNLAQRMNYVMSFGTMIWYRPEALDNLLRLDFTDRVPAEPLPYDSVLHAFERLLVYVSWGNGFDYRISQINALTGFTVNSSANRMSIEAKGDLTFYSIKEMSRLLLRKIKRKIKRILRMNGHQ